jgi:hypothetical protein
MADFNFIIIPELRQCLESDYRELRACLKVEAWKAVHVLAGSIVEAVLIDALSGAGVDQSKLDSMELAQLITLAKDQGILPDEAVELSTVIRKYRNLIHPGRVKRLEKTVDRSGAVVAAEVVEIITEKVAKRKQETYGFTAEQLLERLRGGESALPLVTHLLKDTRKHEVGRLLSDLLPSAYMYAISDPGSTAAELNHLVNCHRRVFDAADGDVKTTVTKTLYKVFRNEPESTVLFYEDTFFRGSDLTYLADNERQFIKAHFLARLSGESVHGLLGNLVGIGPFLKPDEAGSVSMTLMIAMQCDDKKLARAAEVTLMAEYPTMTSESRAEVRDSADFVGGDILAKLEKREPKAKPGPLDKAVDG